MNVVLVHGLLDRASIMRGVARRLTAAGHTCYSPTLTPSDARTGLVALAAQLEHFIATELPAGARLTLVGFSMGALVCRYYLQELGGAARTEMFFSLAGPHAGTLTAYLYPGQGAREMRPDSGFLRRLNENAEQLARLPTVCYWSPLDFIVIPGRSARMARAQNVRLMFSFHPLLVFDQRICRDIEHRLATTMTMT